MRLSDWLGRVLALTGVECCARCSAGRKVEPAATGTSAGIVQAWGGCGCGWHPVPRPLEPVARMGSATLRVIAEAGNLPMEVGAVPTGLARPKGGRDNP
jgi:hypothetical protein